MSTSTDAAVPAHAPQSRKNLNLPVQHTCFHRCQCAVGAALSGARTTSAACVLAPLPRHKPQTCWYPTNLTCFQRRQSALCAALVGRAHDQHRLRLSKAHGRQQRCGLRLQLQAPGDIQGKPCLKRRSGCRLQDCKNGLVRDQDANLARVASPSLYKRQWVGGARSPGSGQQWVAVAPHGTQAAVGTGRGYLAEGTWQRVRRSH